MTASPISSSLARRRVLARAALLFEAVWPALWPAGGVAGGFLVAALLNLPALLPPTLHLLLLVVVALLIIGLLFRGLRRVRMPDDRLADRRLEADSGLVHQPLSVLTDRPAVANSLGVALWQAHVARVARQIGRLRVRWPRPGLPNRDPRAIRHAVLLAVVAALAIAGVDAPARVFAALIPAMALSPSAPPPELQAWITPPAYTRVAPVFLKNEGGAVSVPAGSHLTVNVSGISDAPGLLLDEQATRFAALDNHSFQAETDLARGGLLRVRRNGSDMAAWPLTVVADQPPTTAWGDNPGVPPGGQQTRLPWTAGDDYGITGLQAELRLKQRPNAPPLIVNIPLPGDTPRTAHGVALQDLTAHSWAGLAVTGRLVARDAAGQTGSSAEAIFQLGERPFHNPIARLLIAARKSLSLHPDRREEAVTALNGLMQQPDFFKDDPAAFMLLSSTFYLLADNQAEAVVPEAQDRLWQLALHLEEGQGERTAHALEQARNAAREALDRAQQAPTDANRQALEQRLQALRQAIDQHMRALLEQALHDKAITPVDPNAARLTNRDMQRMAEQAQQAAREGRMADAKQQMSQLERMLDQLRNAHPQRGDSKQANTRRQRGKSQANVVQDLIGREGGLLDHAQQRNPQMQGSPSGPDNQQQADTRMQQALRSALGELMQQFTDLSGEMSPGLGEADQAMRDAVTKLRQGNNAGAGESEQHAIEALQKGGRDMARSMAKMGSQSGQGGNDEPDGEGGSSDSMGLSMMPNGNQGGGREDGSLPGAAGQNDPANRDPLGRTAQGNTADNDDVVVPEQRERQRTQAIEEELRHRDADQARPRQELDYIERLLKRF